MEGWITIGTQLSTGKFDQQYKDLEKKMKQEEEKGFTIKAKLDTQQQELQDARKKVDELANAYQRLKKIQSSPNAFKAGYAEYGEIKAKYGDLNTIDRNFNKALNTQIKLEQQVANTELRYKGIVGKVEEYKEKLNRVNLKQHQEEVSRIKENFSGVGSSIQNAIHKVTRLALGVFGIRSAFLAVRRASSELTSYNPQYAANLEYIRYALTQMIAPVLEYIVNLAKTILAYINYIANAWFGVNLFANASAKSFNQVKKNISGASASAKELQKTITGFDEKNILNSNSTGGGGGVAGAIGPDFDLSDLNAVEIPEWIKWIANNKDIVIGAIAGIATAFLAFKTLQITGILGAVGKAVSGFIGSLGLLQKALFSLGIAVAIAGIVTAVVNFIKFLNDPTWTNFRGVLDGLSIALAGVATAFIAVNASNPVGWIILAVSAVTQLVKWIGDLITNYDEEARMAEQVRQQEEALTDAKNKLRDATDSYINAVDRAEQAEKDLQKAQQDTGISIDDLLKYMDKENLTYKDLDENQRKVYKAYKNNENAQNALKESTNKLTEAENLQQEELYKLIGNYKSTSSSATEYKNKVVQAYNEGKISAKDAAQAISIALGNMDESARKSFVEGIPDAIQRGLNPNNYTTEANSFSSWWNNWLQQIQRSSTNIFGSIGNTIKGIIAQRGNLNFSSWGASSGGYVTKMATGGIINMPNRGVPVANAIAGEAGHEGIIPLTDQQAMAQLGAEIGRNVLVNLTNITSMNGRVISRELKTIQGEQNFAYNM